MTRQKRENLLWFGAVLVIGIGVALFFSGGCGTATTSKAAGQAAQSSSQAPTSVRNGIAHFCGATTIQRAGDTPSEFTKLVALHFRDTSSSRAI